MNGKQMIALVGSGLLLAASWSYAQEQQDQAVPPQQVADGGVEAVRDAQEGAPVPVEKFEGAGKVLRKQAKSRKWREGWDDKKKRIIVIEEAEFKTKDPATDESFFIKREMAAKKAVLKAKVSIIQTINQDMSAMDLVNVPGTDVNKALGAERERLNADLARQKEVLANMLEKVDKAEADVLRGTTFGDRLNDLMAAVIKKLDAEYNADARDEKAKAEFEAAKTNFEAAKSKYEELKEKVESVHAKVQERRESAVESMAKMPLYGSSIIMQTESWDKQSGKYQVAVMLCWSYALERSARAIVTGEEYKVKPSANAKSVQDWLEEQNLAVMVGPRQYIDENGNRWFLGVTARPYDDELSSNARSRNKGIAEMFAQQMAAFCVFADVESYKQARQALESRGDNDFAQTDVVAESYAEKLTQSFRNKKIRGLQRLFSDEVTHPITGNTIFITVYGLNSSNAKTALEIEKINYATQVMDNRYQTVERGRDAANRDAVKASMNRAEDFQKGYGQQSQAVNAELQKREPAKKSGGTAIINNTPDQPAKSNRTSTSGTFSGDSSVEDDF